MPRFHAEPCIVHRGLKGTPAMLGISTGTMFWLLIALGTGAALFWRRLHRIKLPPGPRGWPLLGNALELPLSNSWDYFTKLKDVFGDVVHVDALSQPTIILGSLKAAEDVLVKKGAFFSHRPIIQMAGELVGFNKTLVISQPNASWSAGRKQLHQHLAGVGLEEYHHIFRHEARQMASSLLNGKIEYHVAARRVVANSVLRVAYGSDGDDTNAKFSEWGSELFEKCVLPTEYPVNVFPILRHIPSWFPLIRFKKEADLWAKELHRGVEAPFLKLKEQIKSGNSKPSFIFRMLEDPPTNLNVSEMEWLAGVLYLAGVPSTTTVLCTLLLAMVMYPEVQKKAQEEIDRVVGRERLPDISDRSHLPYLDCIIKEACRWKPPVPLGIPHVSTDDQVYREWTIPKHAPVHANIFAISRDVTLFESPDEFIPERYEQNPNLPNDFIFGFGRRVCAGQDFAQTVLFIVAATLLATVNIRKAEDEDHNEITPTDTYRGVVSIEAVPIPHRLEPRSESATELLSLSLWD